MASNENDLLTLAVRPMCLKPGDRMGAYPAKTKDDRTGGRSNKSEVMRRCSLFVSYLLKSTIIGKLDLKAFPVTIA
ncbi:hypothetical protein Lepil_1599 [Leptonema illini DSM 21528]|uniref:Uncharacterized protein n=1 Tax=Leptonema illini DSM 21528 TaxID=929563 RepID=H2CBB4_9LEPT|nr:hypothetical protein Lepil_1599 [Leptonema illini DSM 21528]